MIVRTVSASSVGSGQPGILDALKAPEKDRIIFSNTFANFLQERRQQLALEQVRREQTEARQREEQERARAEAKTAIRTRFVSDFSVARFVTPHELFANPFLVSGQIVGVHVVFRRMLSEHEAVFSGGDVEVLVEGVQATSFRGDEDVMLAMRVEETKPVKTPTGDVTLPYVEYVGVHTCTAGCSEFQ